MDASLTREKEKKKKTGSGKSIVGGIYDIPQRVNKRKMVLASRLCSQPYDSLFGRLWWVTSSSYLSVWKHPPGSNRYRNMFWIYHWKRWWRCWILDQFLQTVRISHGIQHNSIPRTGLRKPLFYWNTQIKKQFEVHLCSTKTNLLEDQSFGNNETLRLIIHLRRRG